MTETDAVTFYDIFRWVLFFQDPPGTDATSLPFFMATRLIMYAGIGWAVIARLSLFRGAITTPEAQLDRAGKALRVRGKTAILEAPRSLAALQDYSLPGAYAVLCTTLGILGTFYGIYFGLQDLQPSNWSAADKAGTDKMILEIGKLIAGMKTAFTTSLVGMTAAALVTIWDGFLRLISAFWARRQEALLENEFHFLQPEDVLLMADPAAQARASIQLAEAADKMQKSLADASGALMSAAVQMTPDALGQKIGEAFHKTIQTELRPTFDSIEKAIGELAAIKRDNGQDMIRETLTQLRDEVLLPMSLQMKDIVGIVEVSAKASRDAAHSVDTLRQGLTELTTNLETTVTTLVVAQRAAHEELRSFKDDLAGTFRGFIGEVTQTFDRIRTDLMESQQRQEKSQRDMLDKSREEFERVGNHISLEFDRVGREAGQLLSTTGTMASAAMTEARDRLRETITEIPAMLDQTRRQGQQELERFRTEYTAALSGFFAEQSRVLDEVLGEHTRSLTRVVTELQVTFTSETQARSALQVESERYLSQLMASTSLVEQAQARASVLSSDQMARALQIAQESGRTLRDAREAHGEMVRIVEQSMRETTKSLEKANAMFESAAESRVRRLDQAASEVAEKLTMAAAALAAASFAQSSPSKSIR